MRTDVEILSDVHQSRIKKGDRGYIDGYVQGSDDRPYAVVVVMDRGVVDFVSLNQLKPTGIQ